MVRPVLAVKDSHSEVSIPLMGSRQQNMASSKSPANGDPFNAYKDELENKIFTTTQKLQKWRELINQSTIAAPSGREEEFIALTKELKKDIKSSESSVSFLRRTLQMVESKRAQFKHISDAELYKRKTFISRMESEIKSMHDALNSDQVNAQIRRSEKKELARISSSNTPEVQQRDWKTSNAEFMRSEQHKQQQILQDQDQSLDELGRSVTHLGEVAVGINKEVESQNKMLEELGEEIDETQERMNFVLGKMSKLLKTKDKCQLGTIILLSIVLFIMVFLVIYT